jgi:hypothetical protein
MPICSNDITNIVIPTAWGRLVRWVVTRESNRNYIVIHPFFDDVLRIHGVRMLRTARFT